jgi:hypothetical protein
LIQKDPASPQAQRISRVLFMANDGSERSFRECDTLLFSYSQRLVGCRLEISGEELGTALFGAPRLVRAILVSDKKAAARTLLALV